MKIRKLIYAVTKYFPLKTRLKLRVWWEDKLFQNLIENEKDRGEIELLYSTWDHATGPLEEELSFLYTRKLLKKARKIGALTPVQPSLVDYGDTDQEKIWQRGYHSFWTFLTDKGIAIVQSSIRKTKKERNEVWLPWIMALSGLIGSLIGLVAIFKK